MNDTDLLNSLLQRIYATLGAPDTVTGVKTERNFLSACVPGIPLTPAALDFGFTTMNADQIERAADFSNLVNILPSWGASWRPSGRTLSGEYFKVVDQPVLPQTQLTAQEKAAYETAMQLLWSVQKIQNPITGAIEEIMVPSQWQQRYDEYSLKHDQALERYQKAQSEFLARINEPGEAERWAQLKPQLESKVRNALSSWESAGKRKVEEARATIGNLDGRGLQKSWQDRRVRFENYRRSAQVGDFWLTKYYPQKFWEEPAGWLSLSFGHKEVHKVNESEQLNWGGSGSAGFGLWKVGGETSYESQKTQATCDMSSFSLKFELAMIPFLRGWIDTDVFGSRSWKFDSNLVPESEHLSDGEIPPVGTMPVFPTALLLARNVVVEFNKSSEVNKTFMEQVRSSASVGWGPFSVRANYFRRLDKSSHDFVEDNAGLKIPGMQIIGFMCRMIDKSPNPDPNLNWGQ